MAREMARRELGHAAEWGGAWGERPGAGCRAREWVVAGTTGLGQPVPPVLVPVRVRVIRVRVPEGSARSGARPVPHPIPSAVVPAQLFLFSFKSKW